MAVVAGGGQSDAPNHPKSVAMALIASLTFNVVVGNVMGTPGVLLPHMTERLGVSIEQVSMGLMVVMLTASLAAPQIGAMAARRSLRGMLIAAALMLSASWIILAFTRSWIVYMAVYGLLMGPVMAIGGSVFAPTLVTRWFNRHRGLAIGLVHLPILVAILPAATEWAIQRIGIETTFMVLAVLPLVTLVPAAFYLIDWPPAMPDEAAPAGTPVPEERHGGGLTIPQLLRQPRLWLLCLAVGAPNTGSILLGLHLISMAKSWGVAALPAAGLASLTSAGGMIGVPVLGYVSDRIGGARTLALMAAVDVVLWLLFLLHLPYVGLVAVAVSIGFIGSGAVPAVSKAFADAFGRETFSRAIGLLSPTTLPLMLVGLIAPGLVVRYTGSYTLAILGMSAFFAAAAVMGGLAAGGKPVEAE